MTTKKRLIQFLKYLGIGQLKFEETVGVSRGFVNKVGDSIRTANLNKITDKYPNLDTNWLITGVGSMLKTEAAALQMLDAIEAANEDNKIPRKQIDIDAIDFQNTVIIRLKKEAEEKDAVIDKLKVTIVEKETEIKTLKETMKMLFETK